MDRLAREADECFRFRLHQQRIMQQEPSAASIDTIANLTEPSISRGYPKPISFESPNTK
jgi:hypothetical protein